MTHKLVARRTQKPSNKAKIAEDIKDWGEDSDYIRVRVRGIFPRAGSLQFIPSDLVADAVSREGQDHVSPIVFGVDVARFGSLQSRLSIWRLRLGQSDQEYRSVS